MPDNTFTTSGNASNTFSPTNYVPTATSVASGVAYSGFALCMLPNGSVEYLNIGGGAAFNLVGSGSPEGVYVAPVGALYHRNALGLPAGQNGSGVSFYVKQGGDWTNTGWVGK